MDAFAPWKKNKDEGGHEAFRAAWREHAPDLFRYVSKMLRDPAEAEDVVQEAFGGLFRELSRGAAPLDPRAWLFRCCRNRALNRIRAAGREERALARFQHEGRSCAAEAEGDDAAEWERDGARADLAPAARLDATLGALPPCARDLIMRRASGEPIAQIALALGIPQGTVKSRVSNLIRKLREGLA